MEADSQRRDDALSLLDAAIEAMNLAKEVSSVTPAKAVFGSVSALLTMIRDSMANKSDLVELGLACADVCKALERGVNGKRLDDLNQSVREAINQLTTTVAGIRKKVIEKGKRNRLSRLVHAKNDKDTIAAWKLELSRILHIFNTELAINTNVVVSDIRHDVVNTHTIVSDVQRTVVKIQEGIEGKNLSTQASIPGESPPPPPRVCFGRHELIEKIVDFAESLTPLALIGPGGIGKTSIALTVLHHDRIKQRFGDNRRFLRCDQFPASRTHFLRRLSKVIGAGVDNVEDLTSLRPLLSSTEMILFLDNAESVLDPKGADARDIYAVVEELSQFKTLCLCITSRISTVPRHCKRPIIPTLSMESACDIFYGIYGNGGQSDIVNDLLRRLDFHALSITLLATTASHNMWDYNRLAREWGAHHVQILQTDYNESLAATIELSLTSPTFGKLGSDARDLLGVIAFFPQGIDEDNIDWLFPAISERRTIFDKFCLLSLTHRSNGFVTMLAPLRDYLSPKDPKTSPLLCTTKDHYFTRLSVSINPDKPGFEEARWITSEDVNVEHLLDIFMTIDAGFTNVWEVCRHFMEHLLWHKKRPVVFRPKIEGLPDSHPSKPQCLLQLSRLFNSIGNHAECKRLLVCTLKLWRERGDDRQIADTLRYLSHANKQLGLNEEGIEQVKEVLEIFKRLGDGPEQAKSLRQLARLLYADKQLDAAEEAASRVIDLLSDKGEHLTICQYHRLLGDIYRSKGDAEKATNHYETALGIASSFGSQNEPFWIHYSLAKLFYGQREFNDAHTHIERAKSHAINDPYCLGLAMELRAQFWHEERKFEEAKSEILCAIDMFEKLGAADDLDDSRGVLQAIERQLKK